MNDAKVTVEVGQPVIMVSGYATRRAEPGTVVKVGRVWIEIQLDGSSWTRRFRLDTQTDGSKTGISDRFYTLDQWAVKRQHDEAAAFLSDQGIRLNFGSPWRGREPDLADLIRAALEAAPAGPGGT